MKKLTYLLLMTISPCLVLADDIESAPTTLKAESMPNVTVIKDHQIQMLHLLDAITTIKIHTMEC